MNDCNRQKLESIQRRIAAIRNVLETHVLASVNVPGMAASVDRKQLNEELQKLEADERKLLGMGRATVRPINLEDI